MIAPEAGLSVSRQCTLLEVARSSLYYQPRPEAAEELDLLKRLDRIFTDHPVYGSRRLQVALLREGVSVGRRRVRRLMRKLGLWAVRPKEHQGVASRAQGLSIPSARRDNRPAEPEPAPAKTGVWAADIT
jgi:putative transposase